MHQRHKCNVTGKFLKIAKIRFLIMLSDLLLINYKSINIEQTNYVLLHVPKTNVRLWSYILDYNQRIGKTRTKGQFFVTMYISIRLITFFLKITYFFRVLLDVIWDMVIRFHQTLDVCLLFSKLLHIMIINPVFSCYN